MGPAVWQKQVDQRLVGSAAVVPFSQNSVNPCSHSLSKAYLPLHACCTRIITISFWHPGDIVKVGTQLSKSWRGLVACYCSVLFTKDGSIVSWELPQLLLRGVTQADISMQVAP